MKCPECGNALKRENRESMRCTCGYTFIIDPKTSGFTDTLLYKAVKVASKDNEFFVTPNQVYSAFIQIYLRMNRRLYIRSLIIYLAVILLMSAGYYGLKIRAMPVYFFIFSIILMLRLLIKVLKQKPPPSEQKMNEWVKAFGRKKLGKALITVPVLKNPPPQWKEPDIYNYGFEKILVVRRDILVDLFVKNNFHADERTIIISAGGYPGYLKAHVSKMLNDSPHMPVYYLHDSSDDERENIKNMLLTLGITAENRRVIDLGLSKEIAGKLTFAKKVYKENQVIPVDSFPYWVLTKIILQAFGRTTEELIEKARGRDREQGADALAVAGIGFLYIASSYWSDGSWSSHSFEDSDLSFG